jgi:hypothetical protein
MGRLFPPHNAEDPAIYKERVSRAFYFAYAGTIIDNIVAGLTHDPLSIAPEDDKSKEGGEAKELDPDLSKFLEDVSPKRGKRQPLPVLMLEAIREALIAKCGWILVDLPQTPEEYVVESRLDQERAGLLEPYAIKIDAEWVIHWQDDTNGELEWATLCDSEVRQDGFATEPYHRKTFTIYDRQGWVRYRLDFTPDNPPKADTPVPYLDEGAHPFDKVPLVRLKLPDGLWAMGKLESLAREHLNKRCAVAWAEYKSLFAVLYEFLAPEEVGIHPISQAQQDPDRAFSQVYGPGHSQERGHQDSAKYIGPDVAPFKEGRESCDQIMREMHRVFYSMALSANMDTAAIRRSGESKGKDDEKITIILKALGYFVREAVKDILELWKMASGNDGKDLGVRVTGGEKFDAVEVMKAIQEAVELMNGVPMKSPTFTKAFLFRLYKLVMGSELTDEELQQIREELEEAVSMEGVQLDDSMALQQMMEQAQNVPPDSDEDDDEDDQDDDDPPPQRNPPRVMKRMS